MHSYLDYIAEIGFVKVIVVGYILDNHPVGKNTLWLLLHSKNNLCHKWIDTLTSAVPVDVQGV